MGGPSVDGPRTPGATEMASVDVTLAGGSHVEDGTGERRMDVSTMWSTSIRGAASTLFIL